MEKRIPVQWEPVGPGGGGGHFYPAFSPVDPNLMMFACDMGGIYISHDGAQSWRMLPGHIVRRLATRAGFHPANADVIILITAHGLSVSRDRGLTWTRILHEKTLAHFPGNTSEQHQFSGTGIFFHPHDPDTILAGFSKFAGAEGNFVFRSRDGGRTWEWLNEWPAAISSSHLVFDESADRETLFSIGPNGVVRTQDGGRLWSVISQGLPAAEGKVRVTSLAGAWRNGKATLYATVAGSNVRGIYSGGVFKSTDGDNSWFEASNGLYRGLRKGHGMGELMQYGSVTLGNANPDLVYITASGVLEQPGYDRAVWRTTNGGSDWKCVSYGPHFWKNCNFEMDWMNLDLDGGWGWSAGPVQISCCPTHPERVFFVNGGNGYVSFDAGERWAPMFTDRISQAEYRGRGAEVLTCYHVYHHPKEPNRRWIAYTDIGMFASKDSGKSWAYAAKGSPWANTCYELAVDPDKPGRLWGAWSNFHDLPHMKVTQRNIERTEGGICLTEDYGMTWRPLWGPNCPPNDQGTCTTIVLDTSSPLDSRTLYAGFLNAGVWKTTDGGATWQECNNGLPGMQTRNVWRLSLHKDGSLVCGMAAAYPQNKLVAGGVYRSTDGAKTWSRIGADQPFDFLFGVTLNPCDSKVIYVSCFEVPPKTEKRGFGSAIPWLPGNGKGGVYRTTDAGQSWARVLDMPYCSDVTVHPNQPDTLYAATYYHGIFRSRNAGKSFAPLAYTPHLMNQRVAIDPDGETLWVTTFGGGVWRGKPEE